MELGELIASLNLAEVIKSGGVLLVVVLTIIQVAPVKIDPWTRIARAIGRAINGDMMTELQTVGVRVDQNEIDRLRWEILDFANSCQNGRRHSKEEFDHIISMHEKYIKILSRRRETNGQIELAYKYIEKLYQKCLDEKAFL